MINQVLAQGDMFLNSSVSEGLPLAIIEASRAGLVVVATDVGGVRDKFPEEGRTHAPPFFYIHTDGLVVDDVFGTETNTNIV